MHDDTEAPSLIRIEAEKLELEREKLSLDRYKAQLDYKKFVLGSVFVALALAAIPPLFQLATAAHEYRRLADDWNFCSWSWLSGGLFLHQDRGIWQIHDQHISHHSGHNDRSASLRSG